MVTNISRQKHALLRKSSEEQESTSDQSSRQLDKKFGTSK